MKIHRRMQSAALAGLMAAALGAPPAHAQMLQPQSSYQSQGSGDARNDGTQNSSYGQDADLMQITPVREGDITYVSGGIGEGETRALQATAHNYNLQIINSTRQGDYTANTNFVIEGRNGREVIRANDAGPLFYARLPAGNYTVKAWTNGQQEVRHVHISGHKPVDMHLVWQES